MEDSLGLHSKKHQHLTNAYKRVNLQEKLKEISKEQKKN